MKFLKKYNLMSFFAAGLLCSYSCGVFAMADSTSKKTQIFWRINPNDILKETSVDKTQSLEYIGANPILKKMVFEIQYLIGNNNIENLIKKLDKNFSNYLVSNLNNILKINKMEMDRIIASNNIFIMEKIGIDENNFKYTHLDVAKNTDIIDILMPDVSHVTHFSCDVFVRMSFKKGATIKDFLPYISQ